MGMHYSWQNGFLLEFEMNIFKKQLTDRASGVKYTN